MSEHLSMRASDPVYSVVNEVWNLYAIALNPQVFYEQGFITVGDAERAAIQATLYEFMEYLLTLSADTGIYQFMPFAVDLLTDSEPATIVIVED